MNYDELKRLFNKKILKRYDIKHIDYGFLSENILKNKNPRQIIWHLMNPEIKEPLLCMECNEKYVSWMKKVEEHTDNRGGYRKYCSTKCSAKSEKVRQKYRDTCIEKYGVINSFQDENTKKKIKEKNLEKYGVENPQQNKDIKEKTQETNLERYGVENIFSSKKYIEERKKIFIERYGYDNPMKSPEVKEKAKNTIVEKYGVEHFSQLLDIREKTKNTNLEKYGVEYPLQSPVIKDKMKNANMEKYGYENPAKSPEVKEKIKNINSSVEVREKTKKTNLERYGVEFPSLNPEIIQKMYDTNLERYGCQLPSMNNDIRQKISDILKTPDIIEKIKNTSIKRYGVEHFLKSSIVREKIKDTNLEIYGTPYPSQSDIVKNKIKNTNIEKYGVETPSKSPEVIEKIKQKISLPEVREKIKKTNLEKYGTPYHSQSHLLKENIEIINDKDKFKDFISGKEAYSISNQLGISRTSFYKIANRYNLQDYYTRKGSYLEDEMAEFLDELNINYKTNDRIILNGFELDFYIPEYNFAIEMNGDYWHSDNIRDKDFHYNKWKKCKEKNIDLIQILESDWNNYKEKFKGMIHSTLSLNKNTIFPDKFTISNIKNKTGVDFFEKHHLQKPEYSKYYYGAFDDSGQLRAVMSFDYTKESETFELTRWTTDNKNNYPDLFNKIFNYSVNDMNINSVLSFTLNDWYSGVDYMKNGFNKGKIFKPECKFLYKGCWYHKGHFTEERKKIFSYDENIINMINNNTESEIMEYINLYKTWDSGKTEWIWKR